MHRSPARRHRRQSVRRHRLSQILLRLVQHAQPVAANILQFRLELRLHPPRPPNPHRLSHSPRLMRHVEQLQRHALKRSNLILLEQHPSKLVRSLHRRLAQLFQSSYRPYRSLQQEKPTSRSTTASRQSRRRRRRRRRRSSSFVVFVPSRVRLASSPRRPPRRVVRARRRHQRRDPSIDAVRPHEHRR